MTSKNEAKLEELKKEVDHHVMIACEDGQYGPESVHNLQILLDRAFQLGRMEQHERDTIAVNRLVVKLRNIILDDNLMPILGLFSSVSPVEGEE